MTHEAEPHLTILAPSLEQRPPKERQLSLAFPISNKDTDNAMDFETTEVTLSLHAFQMSGKCSRKEVSSPSPLLLILNSPNSSSVCSGK